MDKKTLNQNLYLKKKAIYLASHLAHKFSYEMQQISGGIAFTDNLRIDKALEVTKVQEIIGGARNIKLYLFSRVIKNMISLL